MMQTTGVIQTIAIVGYSVCGSLHVLGIFLLIRAQVKPYSQRLILINTALAALLTLMHLIYYNVKDLIRRAGFYSITPFDSFTACFPYFGYKLFVMYLTLDRVFAVWYHLHYSAYFTKSRLKKISLGIWSISLVYATTYTSITELLNLTSAENVRHLIYAYVSMNFVIILNVFICYSYLYWKVKKISAKTLMAIKVRRKRSNVKIRVPLLLCVSYIVFNAPADYLLLQNVKKTNVTPPMIAVTILYLCGWFTDIITYVLFQKEVRKFCYSLLKCNRRSRTDYIKSPIAECSPRIIETRF